MLGSLFYHCFIVRLNLSGMLGRSGFDDFPNLEYFADIQRSNVGNRRSPTGNIVYEAIPFQRPQSFPYGCFANTESTGKIRLVNGQPRSKLTVDDSPLQVFIDHGLFVANCFHESTKL